VEEAIDWAHDAGGVAVWAHPFWDIKDADRLLATLDRFRGCGLDGVECFYPSHDNEQTKMLVRRCQQLGMLRTGSADFHGPSHGIFNSFGAFELYGLEPELGPIAGA
jgi:predicted metal-dependent phosphoesterase TrpH